jgi:predicted alpha/beta hydrolase family esterase
VLVKSYPDSKSGFRAVLVQSIDDHFSSFAESKDGQLAKGTAA